MKVINFFRSFIAFFLILASVVLLLPFLLVWFIAQIIEPDNNLKTSKDVFVRLFKNDLI